jgi:hypothetical protein
LTLLGADYTQLVRSHQWIDERSLALHTRVAAKVAADPALIETARANLDRWLQTSRSAPLLEWRQLLETAPVHELVELLRSPGERAVWLRQSSPFAGVLTAEERLAILREYDSRRA